MELPDEKKPALTYEELKEKNPLLTHEIFIREEQVVEFEELLDGGAGETEIDTFLTDNPEVFTAALHEYRTGHHGAIVIPKQSLKPKIHKQNERGLIPDFIIGGDSSDGWSWWVVEIKGTSQTLFTYKNTGETYFNSEINKGICQLLEYLDFCAEHQAVLRDVFKLENFREPKGLLIGGRESELLENSNKRKLKSAWNRMANSKLEIRTYDFLKKNLRPMYEFQRGMK